MTFSPADIEHNREYFKTKLGAEKQKAEVLSAVRAGTSDFTLVDTREREDFDKGHIPGAISAPIGELEQRFGDFEKSEEIVTYCYNDY